MAHRLFDAKALFWTNADLSPIRPVGRNFNEIWMVIWQFHSRKCFCKYRLPNGCHFVLVPICQISWISNRKYKRQIWVSIPIKRIRYLPKWTFFKGTHITISPNTSRQSTWRTVQIMFLSKMGWKAIIPFVSTRETTVHTVWVPGCQICWHDILLQFIILYRMRTPGPCGVVLTIKFGAFIDVLLIWIVFILSVLRQTIASLTSLATLPVRPRAGVSIFAARVNICDVIILPHVCDADTIICFLWSIIIWIIRRGRGYDLLTWSGLPGNER